MAAITLISTIRFIPLAPWLLDLYSAMIEKVDYNLVTKRDKWYNRRKKGDVMRRYLPVALLLTLLLAAFAYWYYAPVMTIQKIGEGIAKGDKYTLQEAIDFEKLRANMKSQLKSSLAKEEFASDNPFGAVAAAFATKLIDGMVDAFITPDTLIVKDEKKRRQAQETLQSAQIVQRDLDRAKVRIVDDEGAEYYGILERYGLRYRLTDVIIPESKKREVLKKR